MNVALRACTFEDSPLLLTWRNSVEARSVSQNSEMINPVSHAAWLQQRLSRTKTEPFWIIKLDDKPAGYIRLDFSDSHPYLLAISIFIVDEYRKLGVGGWALDSAVKAFREDFENIAIYARVRIDNPASIQLFQKAGFKFDSGVGGFLTYKLSSEPT